MHLGNDLRHAMRMVRLNPGFSAIAIATLAFGIGINTAIFSIVDGILLRPLGYKGENRLVSIHEVVPKFSHIAPRIPVNAMHFLEWRKSVGAFEDIALIGGRNLNLTGSGEPERLAAARVSYNLFPLLGARMTLGRPFLAEEDQAGRDDVVILSDQLWKRSFAADRNIIGRKILLDGRPNEVVGVLSPNFHFPKMSQLYAMTIAAERPELWKPFAVLPGELEAMGAFNFACIGRLRMGVSTQQALAQLNAAQAHLTSQLPEKVELLAAVVPLQDQITGRSRGGLKLVFFAVGLVLLIGCVNIANLLLARATSRKRELAIRSALGAGTPRLMRQLFGESLVLAGAGGALGVVLAWSMVRLLLARAPLDLPRLDEVHLDSRVLLFTLAISVFAGLLFGLMPAWRLAHLDPQEGIQSVTRGSTEGHGSGRLRGVLVAVEVGLATLCLITAGLLLRSFAKLLDADKGFAVQRIVTVNLSLPESRYPGEPERVRFMRSLVDSVKPLPGVISVGVSNMLPLGGEGGNNLITLEGTNPPMMERPLADIRGVNPEYFSTMGVALRQGRAFGEADRERRVAVVSRLAAERLWPGQNPVGKRLKIGDPDSAFVEVIGVSADVRSAALDKAPTITIYTPYWQERAWGGPSLVVKTATDSVALAPAIRDAIHRIDSELPVPRFQTMEQIVEESVAQRRFQTNLILFFAVASLVLAGLGIYGVVSYSVASRTNEMGIRIALGARGSTILGMILSQAMAPVLVGLGAGSIASIAAGRLLAGLLYGVSPEDLPTISIVVLTLASISALAILIPALRAIHIEPTAALRNE